MKKSIGLRVRGGSALIWFGILINAGTTRAQVGLELPPLRDEENRGVRAGGFVFSPFLEVEGRYHSNLFREASEEGPSPATILGVVPGFRLDNPNPSFVKLRWDAEVRINQYFSNDRNAKNQGRFGAGTTLRADFLPRAAVGFFVLEQFQRQQLPPNLSSSSTYDRNYNHVEVGVQVRPGGGALQFALSYAFDFQLYDKHEAFDFFVHEARLLGTWDLMPKTMILLDADFQVRRWRKPTAGLRVNSMPLRVHAGIRGFVTKKVAAVLKAGVGKGFYKEGQDFTNFIGEAGVGFQPMHTVLLEVGYRRGFEDSYYANWYLGDTAYLNFGFQVFRRVNLTLEGEYTYVQYASFDPATLNTAQITYTANQTSRRDHALKARAGLQWSIFRYLEFDVGYEMAAILTDFRLTTPNGSDRSRYVIHQVFGGLKVVY